MFPRELRKLLKNTSGQLLLNINLKWINHLRSLPRNILPVAFNEQWLQQLIPTVMRDHWGKFQLHSTSINSEIGGQFHT